MNIEKAKTEHSEWIDGIIKEEFPYTTFTPKHIQERINNQKYLILVAKQENIFTGFIELEIFQEKKEARLNAVFVEDAWRAQKIGTKLVEQAINECKHKKLQKIFLLVKENNEGAKHLYTNTGFKFEKIHDKIIEGTTIEQWGQKI